MEHTKKNLVFDSTRDKYGRFCTGWRVYRGIKYYWFDYVANITGDRDKTYKIRRGIVDYKVLTFIRDTDWDSLTPVWIGETVR